MTAQLAPAPVFRSWDNLGLPLVNGKLFTYAAGTTTPQATYTDSTQTTPNTNPVILNFRGEAFVWLNPLQSYKFVLQDAFGNLIWTEDNIQGAIGVASNIVPSTTNTFTLGTPTITFANGYFGPNGAPVLDPVSGNIGYYARTPAEIAASVTPVNFSYAPGPYIDARRYGTDPTGVLDSTSAIQAALNVAQASTNGATVILAPGVYNVTSQLLISANRVRLIGAGMYATEILYAPTADGICLKLANGSTTINQCSLSDFTIFSNDSTHTKTAIDITDGSGCDYERIVIGGGVVVGGAGFWSGGSGSIGIRTHGRDTSGFRAITAFCDKPLVISTNPHGSISIDHHNFHDCFLGGNGNPIVTIEAGVTLTQVSFTGYQAWVLGTGGLFWVDGTSPGSSSGLDLQNVRYENGAVAANYFVQIDVTSPLTSLLIRGGQTGGTNGFHFRNIKYTHIDSFMYTDGTHVALNADSTVSQLEFTQCLWQTGSTAIVTGLMVVDQFPSIASGPLPTSGYLMPAALYQQTIAPTRSGTLVTLAASGTVAIGVGTQLGTVIVNDESTQVAGIFFLKGTNHATTLGPVSDAGFFTITAGGANTINCYWNSGTSQYFIQNGYAVSKTVRFVMDGRT